MNFLVVKIHLSFAKVQKQEKTESFFFSSYGKHVKSVCEKCMCTYVCCVLVCQWECLWIVVGCSKAISLVILHIEIVDKICVKPQKVCYMHARLCQKLTHSHAVHIQVQVEQSACGVGWH